MEQSQPAYYQKGTAQPFGDKNVCGINTPIYPGVILPLKVVKAQTTIHHNQYYIFSERLV